MMLMRAAAISVAALVLDVTLSRRRNRVTHHQTYAEREVDGLTTILTTEDTIEVNILHPRSTVAPNALADYFGILVDRAEHAADKRMRAIDWETLSFHVGPPQPGETVHLILRAGLIR